MYEQVEKPKEDKSRVVANSVAQKKDKAKQGVGFVDNRVSNMNVVTQLGKKSAKKAATARNAAKPQKAAAQGDKSFANLCAYRAGWVRDNNITADNVKDFRKTYPSGIRGHASGKSGDGEQGNTTADCTAYKSWHTKKYGWS